MLVYVFTCKNDTLLEVTYRGSNMIISVADGTSSFQSVPLNIETVPSDPNAQSKHQAVYKFN